MQGCKCCKYFQDEISLLPCPLRGGFKNEDKLALETSIEQPSRHWTGWKTQDGKTNICWNWNQRCFVSRKIFLISLQLINGTRLSRFVLLKLASGKKVRVWSKIECWDVAKDNSAARLPPWWLGFLSAASDCLSWSVFWRSGARVQRGRYRQPHLLINKLPLSRQLQAGHQPGTSAHTGSGSRGRDHGGEVARARVTASWRSRPRARGSSLKAGVLSARTVMAPPRLVTISPRPRVTRREPRAAPLPAIGRRCAATGHQLPVPQLWLAGWCPLGGTPGDFCPPILMTPLHCGRRSCSRYISFFWMSRFVLSGCRLTHRWRVAVGPNKQRANHPQHYSLQSEIIQWMHVIISQ